MSRPSNRPHSPVVKSGEGPTLWIDLTDLLLWSGHLSGIQRVIFNVTSAYANANGARYFVYDFAGEQFLEAAFEPAGALPARLAQVSWQTRFARFLSLRLASRARWPGLRWVPNCLVTPGAKVAAFEPGDTLLILGNVWDQPGLQAALERVKHARAVTVTYLIYDLIPVVAPHLFRPDLEARYAKYLFNAVAVSDLLLVDSKATGSDLTAFAVANRLELPTVEVVHLGDEIARGPARRPDDLLPARSFVLCVGTFDARKNHALLYATWKLARERGIELPMLVIAGKVGYGARDAFHMLTTDPAVKNRVLVLSDIDDSQLRWLYENCRFTVYPSVYEGWGLPIAESLRHGKLCLASRSSSMPEIAGDLIEYFSPFDAAECLAVVAKYLDDDALHLREAMIADGYSGQSWEEAKESLDRHLRRAFAPELATSDHPPEI
jgi:glycosyltransferase involved in cell wall biosynthesis